MASRVLVTGGTGFVGLPLLHELSANGIRVAAVTRGSFRPPIFGVEWVTADLLDRAEARALMNDTRPDRLIHCAWYVEHGRFWTSPENDVWLEASTELAKDFFAGGGRQFLGIGSCAEYATAASEAHMPWPETRSISPDTPYGQAKAELFRRLNALAKAKPGATLTWARLFNLFGPNEHPDRLVPSIIRALITGNEARCTSGQSVRDYASTWFIAKALAALLKTPLAGAVNVASGQAISIANLARAISEIIGRPDLLRLGALPDRPDEAPCMVADIARLTNSSPIAFDIKTDLRRSVDNIAQNKLAGR